MNEFARRSRFPKPTAIITGAGGGMGKACARRLANTHSLVLTDFNQDRLDEVAYGLRDEVDADISALICGDIVQDECIARISEAAESNATNLLIHTAGLSPALAGWQDIIRTNVVATAKLMAAIEPLLSPGFVGVFLASTARTSVPAPSKELSAALSRPLAEDLLDKLEPLLGDETKRTANAYAYSKAWVYRTVQQRCATWAEKGARIVSISPGLILTGMTKKEMSLRPEMLALRDNIPIGRSGTVDDIANVVEFLISDRASFITGTDFVVDGGHSANRLT